MPDKTIAEHVQIIVYISQETSRDKTEASLSEFFTLIDKKRHLIT